MTMETASKEIFDKKLAPPFSGLTIKLLSEGWSEEILKGEEESTEKRIVFPEEVRENFISTILPEKIKELFPDISIKVTSSEEISSGEIVVPLDSYNLANFDTQGFLNEGAFEDTMLNKVEQFMSVCQAQNRGIRRDKICFSRKTNTIFVLPNIQVLMGI